MQFFLVLILTQWLLIIVSLCQMVYKGTPFLSDGVTVSCACPQNDMSIQIHAVLLCMLSDVVLFNVDQCIMKEMPMHMSSVILI